ncbi:MAG: RIP metalloprotease RseP [Thermomicrobiales bacterium]|nr:RIP metalloprotease RseP [Thermomicrobiales bacterium]
MSQGFLNGLYIVPILAILILVHEIGHFSAARAIGAKVEEFGIGFPPRIKGWMRDGVLWSINWLPFGGFVKVLGDDGKSDDPQSINNKSPLQRAFFLVAGSAMNFLLAFVLMVIVVGAQGISQSNVYIASVEPGSPAATATWEPGDRVIEVAGVPVEGSGDISAHAREFADNPMSVVIERGGQRMETTVTPRGNPPAGQGPTGVTISEVAVADIAVKGVNADSPFAAAGLKPGDVIVSIAGQPVTDAFKLHTALASASDQTVPVVVRQGAEESTLDVAFPALDENGDVLAQLGLDLTVQPIFERVPWLQVIPVGIAQAWEQLGQMMNGLRDLFTGRAPLNQIAGPLGMGQATSEIVAASPLPLWVTLANLAILLSLNLAVLNLLPLPALDGGRLLFVIIEILRGGKKLAPEREGFVHFTGLVLLVGAMVIIFVLDALRIHEGKSFLP